MASLAEKLGYGAADRLLILNCDDLGASHSANIAIDDSIRNGIATSATLMVPCPWACEAVGLCGGLDIGIHLTLTCEYPGYRWRALTGAKSLHDADGFMPRTNILSSASAGENAGNVRPDSPSIVATSCMPSSPKSGTESLRQSLKSPASTSGPSGASFAIQCAIQFI